MNARLRVGWTRLCAQARLETPRTLFLRGLGITFALAFASLLPQLRGLWGAEGIAPVSALLGAVGHAVPAPERWLQVPTLFWLSSSEGALLAAAWLGVGTSVALMLGVAPRPCLALAWALYLSFVSTGGVFLGYQWDALLLEAALCGFVYAPGGPGVRARGGGGVGRLLLWALVFKLMWLSGVVKLASGDPSWRNLTALQFHFWTQPLPNGLGLLAARLPSTVLRMATAGALGVELLAPFAIFLGRRGRRVAFAAFVALQVGIALTGNYGFFNLLAGLLALPLLDEATPGLGAASWPARAGAAALFLLLALPALAGLSPAVARSKAVGAALGAVGPFQTFNRYGLFAVMTTTRPEISLEGSDDGARWRPYRFRYQPAAGARSGQVAPYLPRLDWQLWFAALGRCEDNGWFLSFARRLLEGSPKVEGLLASVPFDAPPRYLRASVADFTLDGDGAWAAGPRRPYCPVLTLQGGRLAAVRP